jgi:hypothetical protein
MMRMVSSIVVIIILGTIASNVHAYKSYSEHQLWRLRVKNNEQVAKVLEFSRIAHLHDINFWSEEFRMNVPVSLKCFRMNLTRFLIRSMFVYHLKRLIVLLNI